MYNHLKIHVSAIICMSEDVLCKTILWNVFTHCDKTMVNFCKWLIISEEHIFFNFWVQFYTDKYMLKFIMTLNWSISYFNLIL